MILEEFKRYLNERVVEFDYTKKDGTERHAIGTTNLDIIEEKGGNLPKGTGVEKSDSIIRYYDLEKEGWRSFNANSFIDGELVY